MGNDQYQDSFAAGEVPNWYRRFRADLSVWGLGEASCIETFIPTSLSRSSSVDLKTLLLADEAL
jgi:hypothetical protein